MRISIILYYVFLSFRPTISRNPMTEFKQRLLRYVKDSKESADLEAAVYFGHLFQRSSRGTRTLYGCGDNQAIISFLMMTGPLPCNTRVLEIGAGSGEFGMIMRDTLGAKLVTIDPDTSRYAFTGFPNLRHDFPTVEDFKSAGGTMGQNDIMLINWPFPEHLNPTNPTYDIDAIEALKPSWIVLVYEEIGAAGSKKLRNFVRKANPRHKLGRNTRYNIYYEDTKLQSPGPWYIKIVVMKRNTTCCVVRQKPYPIKPNMAVNSTGGCMCPLGDTECKYHRHVCTCHLWHVRPRPCLASAHKCVCNRALLCKCKTGEVVRDSDGRDICNTCGKPRIECLQHRILRH